jgi:hypothetical protein
MSLFKKYLYIIESNNSLLKDKTFFESNEYKINSDLDELIEQALNRLNLKQATSSLDEIFEDILNDFESDDIFSENYFDNFNKKLSTFLKLVIDDKDSFLKSEFEDFIEHVTELYFNLLYELINILKNNKDYNSYLFKEINDTYNQKTFDMFKSLRQKPNKYEVSHLLSEINPSISPKIAMFSVAFGRLYDEIREPIKTEEEESRDIQYKFDVDDITSRVEKYFNKPIIYILNHIEETKNKIKKELSEIEKKNFLENKKEIIKMAEEISKKSLDLIDAFDSAATEIEYPSKETEKYLTKYKIELKVMAPLIKNILLRFIVYLKNKPELKHIISDIVTSMEFGELSEY